MSIESSADWDGLRAASAVAADTLRALMHAVEPGVTTGDLDRLAANLFASRGAHSAPARTYGFPGAVLISVNDEIVHGVPGRRVITANDVVSLDVTVELNGYIADAARTVVIGRGYPAADRLARCATTAFGAGLAAARVGRRVTEIGRAVAREVRRHRFSVVKGLAGHGVGRAIHEPPTVPNEWDPFQRDVLTEGLVITIEPMIAAGSSLPVQDDDGWTVRTSDGSLAAHHEDTIVITGSGPIVLTDAA